MPVAEDFFRVYGFTQNKAHLLLRFDTRVGPIERALCGAEPPLDSWLGLDDHFQVDKALRLPLCQECKGLLDNG